MPITSIIHLTLLDPDKRKEEHFYFGSLKALTDMFKKDKIGITYNSLRAYISKYDYPYENKRCIIRKGELHQKKTKRGEWRKKTKNDETPIERIITYSKPSDEYGMLGNMAGGMPIVVNGHKVYASEHLYLCGYWSNNTDLHKEAQEYCLSQKSGTYAKRCAKGKYIKQSRTDFNDFKHDWMIWVVWQKALQNESFRDCLLGTGDAHIYEVVPKDAVWAAYPDENGVLQGANGMGEILMMIRDCLRKNVEPTYNKDLLNKSEIYFLGERLTF